MSQHLAVEIEIIANATYWLPVTTWLDAVASIKGDNNANINTESNVLDIGVARALETKRWNYIIYIYLCIGMQIFMNGSVKSCCEYNSAIG